MMDDLEMKQIVILSLCVTSGFFILFAIKIQLEGLIWVLSSFYSRNGALWLISFTVIYAFRPELVVVLYFTWKLLLTVAMDLYLTKNEQIQVLMATKQAGIPLRIYGFPCACTTSNCQLRPCRPSEKNERR